MLHPVTEDAGRYWFARHSKSIIFLVCILGVVGAWEALTLPLPSARVKPEPGATWLPVAEAVLRDEGLSLPQLKVKGMQKPFFSKGDRPACVRPEHLASEPGPDELNTGRRKLVLRFDLPRGSYATMLVKRVTSPSPTP